MTTCSIDECIRPVERGRVQCSAHRKAAQRAKRLAATEPSLQDRLWRAVAPDAGSDTSTSAEALLGHPGASRGRPEPSSAPLGDSESSSTAAEVLRWLGVQRSPRPPVQSTESRGASPSQVDEAPAAGDILGKPRVQKTNDCLVTAARLPGQQAAEDAQVPEVLPEFLLRRLRRRAWSPFHHLGDRCDHRVDRSSSLLS